MDATDKVEGNYSQRITITGAHAGSYRGIKHDIHVKNGHTYRLKFWCKASGNITFVRVSCGTFKNIPPQYPYRNWITEGGHNYKQFYLTSNWQEFTHEFTVDDNRDDAALALHTAGQNGTIWFDNVKLLDLTQPTRQIEPQLLAKYKELGITSIRWAGSVVNTWHWKDDTLNPDPDNRYFTIDHFMQIAEALGAEPFITVNYGSGTAQEAADLVEYLNGSPSTTYGAKRATNGHTEPYNAKWFILGNEFPGYWEVCEPDRRRCDTATGYGAGVFEFSNAMKAKDPNIKIAVVGNFDPDWNREFVGTAGCDSWDAYDLHFGYPGGYPCTPADSTKRHNGLTEEETFYAAMTGPDQWEWLLSKLEKGWGTDSLEGLCHNKVPVPIFSSEWNDAQFTNASVNPTVCNEISQHLASLEAGLYAAIELPMAMNSVYQWSMNWFLLVTHKPVSLPRDYSTPILDSWDNPQFRPSGLVYKLANAHLTGNFLRVDLKSSWYSNKALGNIKANTRPHLVVAAVKVNSSKIKLWVVNRHYNKALTSKITIQNFTPASIAKTYTLNATNTTDVYAAITESTTTVGNIFTYTFPVHSLTVIDINSK
jgi:alpha-L-arabinofuranosidase